MNKKQKIIIFIAALMVIASLITWYSYGGDIWTKTQVLVEKEDELFGTTYKEFEDKFVLGLDYTAAFVGAITVLALALVFFTRTKKSSKNVQNEFSNQ